MREHTVTIEKMAFGGAGVCRVDGKVCFVPFTAIGDTARIRIVQEKRSYMLGELLDILEPAAVRVDPPCAVFGLCGGCTWQHLDYAAQLSAKEEIFAETLWRIARVERSGILPIAGAEDPYGYRTRVQLKMRHVQGETHFGFYKTGSHYVIDIPQRCAISCPAVNRTLLELRNVIENIPEPDKVPQIDISAGDNEEVNLIFHFIGERYDELSAFLTESSGKFSRVAGIFLQSGRKASIEKIYGRETVSYTIPAAVFQGNADLHLHTSRGGFSQVNFRQNNTLIETALNFLQPTGKDKVLDLYCGNGNFSLPVACCCSEVVGFEEYDQSIRDADFNRTLNNVRNARFVCADAVAGLSQLAEEGVRFDAVLLDPPRSGAAEAVKMIPDLGPGKIIYISCDPPTLARDLANLQKQGYDVVKSRPVDMFPQTYHIESVTLLEKHQET